MPCSWAGWQSRQVRLLTYIGLLYQDLLKSGQVDKQAKLPPVLPLVIYNGNRRWTAPTSLSDLVEPNTEELTRYQPQLSYSLIDENRYTAQEMIKLDNLTAQLIGLELAENEAQLLTVVSRFVVMLQGDHYESLRRAILQLLVQRSANIDGASDSLANAKDLMEAKTMLSDRIDEWRQRRPRSPCHASFTSLASICQNCPDTDNAPRAQFIHAAYIGHHVTLQQANQPAHGVSL